VLPIALTFIMGTRGNSGLVLENSTSYKNQYQYLRAVHVKYACVRPRVPELTMGSGLSF
jgi:hypothetical protein